MVLSPKHLQHAGRNKMNPDLEIECQIDDIIQLYRAYMPFVKGGALFLPTEKENIKLGDVLKIKLSLPEAKGNYEFSGKVIWLTPRKLLSEDAKTGIGVHIEGADATEIREQIEILIKDYLNSDQPTDTM